MVQEIVLVFHKANLFRGRLSNNRWPTDALKYWELYLSELQIALSRLKLHEKKFLEDFYVRGLDYKNMYLSKSNYYSCLNKYSLKFLSLFDLNFFKVLGSSNYIFGFHTSLFTDDPDEDET